MVRGLHETSLAHEAAITTGADLLALIRSSTDALGESIGAGDTRRAPAPSSTALQEALARFGRKVGAYCRLLAAKVDEDDATSVQRFLDAVAPIDAYRAATRSPSDGGQAEAPAPVVNGASNGTDESHA